MKEFGKLPGTPNSGGLYDRHDAAIPKLREKSMDQDLYGNP